MNSNVIRAWLNDHRTTLEGYSYYLGDEVGTKVQNWETSALRICLVFVGPYETGAGNLAVPLLQSMIQEKFPSIYVDRAYAPSSRMDMKKFEESQIPIFGVESKQPLKDFDVVGFSVSYSVGLPQVLRMLRMSDIPLEASARSEEDPLIVGGGHSFNVYEAIAPAIDCVAGGDGEATLPPMLELLLKSKGTKREDFLKSLCGVKGWYVPRFYRLEYKEDGSIKAIIPTIPEAPFPVEHAIKESWDESFAYIKPLIPFCDNGMGLGNVLISMGCENKCRFCAETFSVGPYRELSFEQAYARLRDIYTNSGSVDITPSAFSSGSYTCKKRLFKELIENVSNKINLISQRVNNYSDDENFADLARFVGDKTVSLGVEGNSQRMRDRFNKGIDESQILKAVRFCMQNGYQKVKLFMISNPPLETDEDRHEVIGLAQKIADLKASLGAKTEVKFSWTQMVTSPFTPMQFLEVTKEQLEGRNMKEIIAALKEMGLGFRFGSGGAYDEAYFQQALIYMDRRFYPILKRIATVDGFVFYGNVPGGFKEKVEEYMKEIGLSFEQLFKAKAKGHVFAHDIWDVGIKRDWLWAEKEKYERAETTVRCKVKCAACGACSPELQKSQRKMWSVPDPDIDPSTIKKIQQRSTICRVRLKVLVDADHGGVVRDYWKWSTRRACNVVGYILNKDVIELGSDDIKIPIRVSGIDYLDIKMGANIDLAEFVKKVSPELKHLKILEAAEFPADVGLLRNNKESAIYRVKLTYDQSLTELKAKEFMGLSPIPEEELTAAGELELHPKNAWRKARPQVAQVLVPDFAKGVERILVDLRTVVRRVWTRTESGGVLGGEGTYLYMHLDHGIAPQYIMGYFYGLDMKEASMLDFERVDYLKKYAVGQPSFFDGTCTKCNAALPKNLMGAEVSFEGGKCPACA